MDASEATARPPEGAEIDEPGTAGTMPGSAPAITDASDEALGDDGLDALPDDAEDIAEFSTDELFTDEAAPASVKAGRAVIRAHWQHAPVGPGVYRMLGADDAVLYVGKAKSVRKRIASYMRVAGHTNRIARMVALTVRMVFVSTATETEALLLETNLIKQLRPRFNVLMRDDKSFPYILLTAGHPAPQLVKHRGARTGKGDFFGPFASTWAVNRTLNALERAFLLRSCSDSYYENRTRPCLQFQIKRCSAPCTGEVSEGDYATLVKEARDFLSGKSRAVRDRLAAEMGEAADLMEFERAARLRDRIAALSAIQGAQGINPKSTEEADVFAVIEQAGQFCIEVFFFRTFQNWGNRAYFPKADRTMEPAEVLDGFVAQFYDDRPPPKLVLLSHDIESRALLEQALCERHGTRVEIAVPQRGEKRELVEHAATNAKGTLSRTLAETASQEKLLGSLAQAFGLERTIRRVEVYDNSHIMGTNAVGAMVVAGPGGFMRTHYRTFNIKGDEATPGDDFGMMKEVLRRRFTRLNREAPAITAAGDPVSQSPAADSVEEGFPARPDLILIDGGRGQFNATRTILDELGVTDVAVVAIAKGRDRDAGRETFFVEGREPFRLAPRDPALYFVERLRDEAHRFAIGTHRAKRKKDFVKSPLDEITGIGPARKRALLNAFGTAKALSRAALGDLEKVPGINAGTAKLVYDHFHEGR